MQKEIADASREVGHVGLFQDVDGTIRALPLLIDYHGPGVARRCRCSWSSRYLGANWRDIRFARGRRVPALPGRRARDPGRPPRAGPDQLPGPGKGRSRPPRYRSSTLMDELKERDSLEALGQPAPPGHHRQADAARSCIVCNTATHDRDRGLRPDAVRPDVSARLHARLGRELAPARRLPGEGAARHRRRSFWLLLAVALAIVLAALTPVALALTVLATVVTLLVVSLLDADVRRQHHRGRAARSS